jgi:hypothetical protein
MTVLAAAIDRPQITGSASHWPQQRIGASTASPVKCHGAVNGGIDQATFGIAFDHAQQNSTLHAPLASTPDRWREPA